MNRRLIVTHHAPDLDAIAATWMLKRFDAQHYATAQVTFVDPGDKLTDQAAETLGFTPELVTHVDTGLGKFDHHQPERGQEFISAASLVYEHVCQVHPDLKDDQALKTISEFVTEIDHFREIYWPDAGQVRYNFMIHELIRGLEFQDPHDDDSQLHFGMTCLDSAYATLTQRLKADEIIQNEGITFDIPGAKALALETSNDDTIKVAQKQGIDLVIRKDPKLGSVRVKLRPDTEFDLKPVADLILKHDQVGTWYYHPSGKMFLNGSSKQREQKPTPLSLAEVIALVKEAYGQA